MKRASANRTELDAMVVNIELTLSSIVQGVALYFLADNARSVLAENQRTAWPYVLAGLLIILLFWSRSIIHVLTVIRWPLEFGHNFFYVACVLVEALAFTRLKTPFAWFVLIAIFSALVWGLVVYDQRIIRTRADDSAGPAGCRLYALVSGDQRLNIWLVVPAIFAFNVACAYGIKAHPAFFLQREGHLILILCETAGLAVYLAYVVRCFARLTPLIRETRQEWRSDLASDSESA
ncbi:MAG: hypothetical protein ABI871_04800 [Chthoniobacterales bacterium]